MTLQKQNIKLEKDLLQNLQKKNSAQEPSVSSPCKTYNKKDIIKRELLHCLLRHIATSVTTKNSFGKLQFQNSNSYFGWLDTNGFSGFGTYTFAVGASLKGTFERSLSKGLGSLAYVNGDVYEGEFVAGCPHGYGQYKSKKFQYIGYFQNGKFNGKGIWKTRTQELEGVFHDGTIRHGEARDSCGVFNGTFNESHLRKSGKFTFKNGNTYNGFWSDNKFDGFGEYNWTTQEQITSQSEAKYIGYWKNGNRHGLGMLIFNQRRVICQWSCDKKTGAGIIIACNGTCYSSKEIFIDDHYKDSQCIKNCQESREALSEAIKILTLYSKYKTLEEKIKAFANVVKKLLDQCTGTVSPMNPIRFPDYEIPDGSFTPFLECKHLQQVLVENYTTFKNLYKKYSPIHNECLNYLGLNLFYMDVFHEMRGINVAECLRACQFAINETRIYFDNTNYNNLLAVVSFYEFFQHFVYVSNLLMDNEALQSKAEKLRPTFFGKLAMGVLLLLRMLDNKEPSLFLVREGARFNFQNMVKLLNVLKEMFMGEKNVRTAFKFLKFQNVIKGRCTELRETIEMFYGVTKANEVLCDNQYKLSDLEVIEIILRTTRLRIMRDNAVIFSKIENI